MHADDGATNVAAALDAETEGAHDAAPGGVALPVHLPGAAGDAAFVATDPAKAEEVRGLLAAIRRLESVVEEETVALATGKKIDFDDFSTRKGRGMLEFIRLMR